MTLNHWRKRRAIKKIRKHMACLGIGLYELSDEDIENAIRKFALIIRKVSPTVDQVSEAFRSYFGASEVTLKPGIAKREGEPVCGEEIQNPGTL